MPLSMHQAAVPVYAKLLTALSAILDKASAYAAERKIDPAVLTTARLYPDMWSLAEQVRSATSFPVRSVARLAGQPIPQYEGKGETIADLKARIAWTLDFIKGVDPVKFEGSDEREIVFPSGDTQRKMSGRDYLLAFAMPNFYFHLTTAYDILRHNGVPIGKDDFMGDA